MSSIINNSDCGCSNCINAGNKSICSECAWDSKWEPAEPPKEK